MHTCAGQRSTSGVVPWEHHLVFTDGVSHWDPELANSSGLTGQRAVAIPSLPPHARVPTAHLTVFLWVLKSSHLQCTSYQLTYLPSPSSLIVY